MKPPERRRIIVLIATMAAILAVVWRCPSYSALAWIGLILLASCVAYPSPAWLRVRDFCCWIPWALADKVRKPATAAPAVPEDPEDAAQRKRYHLDLAEYDARIQIGMPLGHLERLAYNLPNPEEWDKREAEIWPDGEWTGVIEEVRREQGWTP